jgi:hypothetical protein
MYKSGTSNKLFETVLDYTKINKFVSFFFSVGVRDSYIVII